MVKPQLLQAGHDAEEGSEDTQMSGVGFGPALKPVQRAPEANIVGNIQQVSVTVNVAHKAVAVAAESVSLVTQKIHACLQRRQHLIEVKLALLFIGLCPVLAGADKRNVVVTLHDHPTSGCGIACHDAQLAVRPQPVIL